MKQIKEVITTIKKFIIEPGKAFEDIKKKEFKLGLIYALFGLTILGILNGVISLIIPSSTEAFGEMGVASIGPAAGFFLIFISTVLGGFLGLFLMSLWLHLWAYIFGARQGLIETIRIVIYGKTPDYYFGWIPIISFLAAIWSMILVGIGLMKIQNLDKGKAIAVILISIVIPGIIIAIFLLFALSTLAGTGAELIPY